MHKDLHIKTNNLVEILKYIHTSVLPELEVVIKGMPWGKRWLMACYYMARPTAAAPLLFQENEQRVWLSTPRYIFYNLFYLHA